MSGPYLVTLRPRDYEANFELVVTDRTKNECTVIPLTDDLVARLAGQFTDAVIERHYWLKRQDPPHDQPRQHQQAAE